MSVLLSATIRLLGSGPGANSESGTTLPGTAALSWQEMPWLTQPWRSPRPRGAQGHVTHRERADLSIALLSRQLATPWKHDPKKKQLLVFWFKMVERDGPGGSGNTGLK